MSKRSGMLLLAAVLAPITAALTVALRPLRHERDTPRRADAAAPVHDRSAPSRPSTATGAAEGSFAAFMAAFPYPAFIQDEHGGYVFVNEAGTRLPEWRETCCVPRTQASGAGAGERHFLSIRFPLDVAGRSLLGGIAIDVTQLRQYEAELRLAVQRRDEFLAVLAHELRNPLTPVQHSVQILHRAPEDLARVRKATATIDRQVSRMERLIDDLLDVARISQGLVALDCEARLLDALVDGALDVVRPYAERSGHRFEVAHDTPGACAHADALRAEQILVNLLSNAIKYSPNGTTVRVVTGCEDGMCRIAVSDQGQGIPPELQREIFTMFARPGVGTRPRSAGMGVGLAVARRLAEQHGGRIDVASAGAGCGATFTAWLPAADRIHASATAANASAAADVRDAVRGDA